MIVPCKLLRPDAKAPAYASAWAAGADLYAVGEHIDLQPGARALVPTGLVLEIPPGYEGQIRPRSGWARDHAITVLNAPGTIDSDFRGEVRVLLVNLGSVEVRIHPGDRIAQLVIAPVERAQIVVADELSSTTRGAGGFGSTGR